MSPRKNKSKEESPPTAQLPPPAEVEHEATTPTRDQQAKTPPRDPPPEPEPPHHEEEQKPVQTNNDDFPNEETAREEAPPKTTKSELMEKREKFLTDLAFRLRRAGDVPNVARLQGIEMKKVALYCREKCMKEPGMLDLEPPMVIVGDIHGQFSDLTGMFDQNGDPPNVNFLFLGDYVDRGPYQCETIALLMAYKVLYPQNIFLLRGNHETRVINRTYGFLDELKTRFGDTEPNLWELYQSAFSCLSLCARVGKRIFCMHGGIPKDMGNWKQLEVIRKPLEVPDHGIICDLLWADPDPDTTGFQPSPRGVSFMFGEAVCKEFCKNMSLDLIVRAHQVAQDGYEFFANRHLVTIFSAPFYCEEFDNTASVLVVDENMTCRFRLRQPVGIERKVLEMTLKDDTKDEPLPCDMDPPDKSRLPVPPKLNYVLGDDEEEEGQHIPDECKISVRDLSKKSTREK
ncbi:unnamed protein product [Bursaphelenchus okinawaensis]|uniref:Serine/threonine-protein phosphatase n=1 Tax=Bursaphelenchus okinawaensis TaxID=465554 RepID=A0A811JV10_9BILA|nr:unnamed protein product [Bursaphelenchus okinawaensis]CAG9083694.1 unnamed protein product [Bursaphelenchus okinawaensis]